MCIHRPIGHQRSDPTGLPQRKRSGNDVTAGPCAVPPFVPAFDERLASSAASALKTRKELPRLGISSNKQKQVREVSVRFMVIGGEPPKKIDIRQNACYSLSK